MVEIGVQNTPRLYSPIFLFRPKSGKGAYFAANIFLVHFTVNSFLLFRVYSIALYLILPRGHAATRMGDFEASGTSSLKSFRSICRFPMLPLSSQAVLITELQLLHWFLFRSIQLFLLRLVGLIAPRGYSFFIQLHLTIRTLYYGY